MHIHASTRIHIQINGYTLIYTHIYQNSNGAALGVRAGPQCCSVGKGTTDLHRYGYAAMYSRLQPSTTIYAHVRIYSIYTHLYSHVQPYTTIYAHIRSYIRIYTLNQSILAT